MTNKSATAPENLYASLTRLSDEAEVRRFLVDLCTPQEMREMEERWRVAQLLDDGTLSYRDIRAETGVSLTTITRVARFLRDEPHQGYRLILDRIKKKKAP
jgi:TrpR-related protein YerC/YecD